MQAYAKTALAAARLVSAPSATPIRAISTTSADNARAKKVSMPWETFDKNNMLDLVFHNKRHLKVHKKMLFKRFGRAKNVMPDIPRHDYGCRSTGLYHEAYFENVKEMEPELVVPDLTDFSLKPYVSYRTKEIYQEELTAYDLFNATYGKEIMRRYEAAREAGEEDKEMERLENEELSLIEDAEGEARKTGADKMLGGVPTTLLHDIRWERK